MCDHIVGYCYDLDGEEFYEVTQSEYHKIDRSNVYCILEYQKIRWYKFCPECGEEIKVDLNYSYIEECKHCRSKFKIQLTKVRRYKDYWVRCECGLPIFRGCMKYDVSIEMLESTISGDVENWKCKNRV